MLDAVTVDHRVLDERKRAFDEFGYVVIPDVLPPAKVAALLAAIEEIRGSVPTAPGSGLTIRPVIDKHRAFEELLIWPSTFATVVKLLGHYNIQLTQSHVMEAVPSHARRLTGWHSDGGIPSITVNGIRAFGSLKVGYSLRDLTQANSGSLMVVPGSHRIQGAPPFHPDTRDPVGAVELRLGAGDAVVFQQGVWHAAAPNLSQQTRVLVYFGYGYRVFRPVDYQHMPAHVLAGRDGVARQLLGETVTHQGYYVPTLEDAPLRTWYEANFGESADRGGLERVATVAIDP